MRRSFNSLCVFLKSGKTFTFKDVEITTENETVLQFTYCAMSDGKMKTATFFHTAVAGYSVTETEKSLKDYCSEVRKEVSWGIGQEAKRAA